MKVPGARAAGFCARPDPGLSGALLFGPDAALVAARRRELTEALTGGDALRLSRIEAAQALKDPAAVDAALRTRGFFSERPVVLVDGARDTLAQPLEAVLAEVGPEDGFLIVTADNLPARSALRRLFEGDGRLAAVGLYPEPPDGAEIEALLKRAGLAVPLDPAALDELVAVAAQIDRGALMQMVEKIAVYALGRTAPLGPAELAALAQGPGDAALDDLIAAVAEGRPQAIGPLVARLAAGGAGPTSIVIAAGRHFRNLLSIATASDGIEAALGRLRPPVFGPRRTALARQVRGWGPARLETAIRLLFQTDASLRSAGSRPERALVERCLIRLAMMADRG